ncbi:hypothetical protein BT96DRAFT_1017158 [Gymnopus androsaceus JB14]|uniref:Uncharacterized protein n=1 Tax=Gymnopus androsaceus JB14 TaxID=1447944 RepID=A0A6A4I2R6_9AGAR|nr:hypothetical protein BT96DRAFT_1017158 [Gymnopus androsaceus JB14]
MLYSNCQKPSFEPRVDLHSLENYTERLFGSDPFTLDLQEAKEMVILCDKDLEGYEVELMRLQSQMLFIREQHMRLRAHRAKLHSFTSPVRKTPNEILALIFDYACEVNLLQEEVPRTIEAGDRITTLTSPIISYLPALSLSATCTRWCSVAKSFSSLWSRLRLEIVSGETPASPAFVSMVEFFLMRSNQHPLEITLVIESWRWKSFKYEGSYLPSYYFSYDFSQNFSNLESLVIEDSECTVEDLDIFQNAPKLQKLSHLLYGQVLTAQIPWNQVTDMALWMSHEQLDKILDVCPNLTMLELWEDRGVSISPCNPLRTSKTIDTLNVIVNDCDTPQGILEIILSSLTLPALNKIFISSNLEQTKGRQWPKDLFATFLSRSSCRITTLVIRGVDLSDEDLISALRILLSLTTLEISDHSPHHSTAP